MLIAVLSGFALALFAPFVHRLAGKNSGWLLGLLPLGLCAYFISLVPRAAEEPVRVVYEWAPAFYLNFSFLADGLGLTFAILISGIGFLVTVYSGGYLKGHPLLGRWYAYLLIFMASMLGVVLSDNIVALFVFWELTSLSSYLLIGFHHEEEQSRAAALQALLVTGGGGLALMAGVVLIIIAGGTAEMSELAKMGDELTSHALYLPILLLILAGAFTKSAQFPFHFWLPNAMAAPTPASAYLHSSTMVKAGIYLLARLSPALGGTDEWRLLVTLFGAVTMFFGAYLAIHQQILKRLLAYTTVSALGIIVMALGIGGKAGAKAAIAFIFAHAFYKAALFMGAGSVDHEAGERNVYRLGGLRKHMPLTSAGMGVAALSMSGVPLFFGFVGKELFYESAVHGGDWAWLLTAASVLSSMFFIVVAGLVALKPFFGEHVDTPHHPHEAPLSMWLGPAVLAVCTLVFGIMPFLAEPLLAPAADAIAGKELHMHLKLWHGFNLVLGLSALTLAGGVLLYIFRDRLIRWTSAPMALTAYGPETWYKGALSGMMWSAKKQTAFLQNGYLRYYFGTVLVVLLVLSVPVLWGQRQELWPLIVQRISEGIFNVRLYELGVAAIVIVAIGAAVHSETRLAAIAALGVVGYGIALIFVLFGAPDLAMTQLVVETLTVILFVLVFYHLPPFAIYASKATRVRDLVLSIAVGLFMGTLVLVASAEHIQETISGYFLETSYELAHGKNIVNVILVDFRALDTMGEITVLAIAAIGAFALLRLQIGKPRDKKKDVQ